MATAGLRKADWVDSAPVRETVTLVCQILAAFALVILGVRAAVRLEPRWDTFAYHIPGAAELGGLGIPFTPRGIPNVFLDGFPPLPHFVQGLLWRMTGSINATGVAGFLALCLFMTYCHLKLRAPWWLVTLISLTAPLVIIHSAASYVDLFGNALLAAGVSTVFAFLLVPEKADHELLALGALGLAGAAWSKYILTPVSAVFLLVFGLITVIKPPGKIVRMRAFLILLACSALAAIPYIRNLSVFGNPFWPLRVPVASSHFPYYLFAPGKPMLARPYDWRGEGQSFVFLQSLLEAGHPTSYEHRPRWIIDQGNADVAFRAGGFWYVGVIAFLSALLWVAFRLQARKGKAATLFWLGLLSFVSFLPQSNELRYFLFLPLTWGAGLAVLFPEYRLRHPREALFLLALCAGLFSYMAWVNGVHYRIERVGYREAAAAWGVDTIWPALKPGNVYCAVNMGPKEILLTGPSMKEFRVETAMIEELCSEGSIVVSPSGIRPRTARATAPEAVFSEREAGRRTVDEKKNAAFGARVLLSECRRHMTASRWVLAIEAATRAIEVEPDNPEAFHLICASRAALFETDDALNACHWAETLKFSLKLYKEAVGVARTLKDAGVRPLVFQRTVEEHLSDARKALDEGRHDDAVEAAARALRVELNSAKAYGLICAASAGAGRQTDAVRACRMALQLAPDMDSARVDLSRALLANP